MEQGKSLLRGVEFGGVLDGVVVNQAKGESHNAQLKTNWNRRTEAINSNSYHSEEFQECYVSRVVLRRHLYRP